VFHDVVSFDVALLLGGEVALGAFEGERIGEVNVVHVALDQPDEGRLVVAVKALEESPSHHLADGPIPLLGYVFDTCKSCRV
jgi:hypothetical protein